MNIYKSATMNESQQHNYGHVWKSVRFESKTMKANQHPWELGNTHKGMETDAKQ